MFKFVTFCLFAGSLLAAPITRPVWPEDGHGIQPSEFIGASMFAVPNSIWLVGWEDQEQPSHEGPDPGALGDYQDWLAKFRYNAEGTGVSVDVLGNFTCCPAVVNWSGITVPWAEVVVSAVSYGQEFKSGTNRFYVEQIYEGGQHGPVPEPATIWLLGAGAGLILFGNARRKK